MFLILFVSFFNDTGFGIIPSILTEGSTFENSKSLISNAEMSMTLTFGCRVFILLKLISIHLWHSDITHKTRSILLELFLKYSNARSGSVNP